MFITGVVVTGDKLFSGVNDTGEKFIAGVRWTIYISRVSLIPFRKKPKRLKFIAGVNDTIEKLFTGVNNTADKFFAGVSDTGDQRVLPILACLHLKI